MTTATMPVRARRSLLGDLLRSKAAVSFLAVLVTVVGRNVLALAGLAMMDVGAFTASRVTGYLVTGASLLLFDFKLRG